MIYILQLNRCLLCAVYTACTHRVGSNPIMSQIILWFRASLPLENKYSKFYEFRHFHLPHLKIDGRARGERDNFNYLNSSPLTTGSSNCVKFNLLRPPLFAIKCESNSKTIKILIHLWNASASLSISTASTRRHDDDTTRILKLVKKEEKQ